MADQSPLQPLRPAGEPPPAGAAIESVPSSIDEAPAWTAIGGTALWLTIAVALGFVAKMLARTIGRAPGSPLVPMELDPVAAVASDWAMTIGGTVLLILVARSSARPWRQRLGLQRGRLPGRDYATVAVIHLATAWLGLAMVFALLSLVHLPHSNGSAPSTARVLEVAGPSATVLLIIGASLLTGIWEETLYRGYLQRALLAEWHPRAAILFTAVAFSAMHGGVRGLGILPAAILLGWLAWRTDSILPGILGHTVVNASSYSIRAVAAHRGDFAPLTSEPVPDRLRLIAAGALAIVAVAVIAWGCWRVVIATRPVEPAA